MEKSYPHILSAFFSIISVFISIFAMSISTIMFTAKSNLLPLLIMALIMSIIASTIMVALLRKKKEKAKGFIFLIYADEDKEEVSRLYSKLQENGLTPWMAYKDILPGQKWTDSIKNAIEASDIALVCITKNLVNKEGFVQKELNYALNIMEEKREGLSPVIPVRFEAIETPERLKNFQWLNIFEENGFERLVKILNESMQKVNT